MFGLTHKEKIKKLMEAITPIADTVKLCTSKKILRDHRDSAKNDSKMETGDLTNTGNLVELS